MFLLDTNVVSEPTKKQPSPKVLSWLAAQRAPTLFMSVVSLGELTRGLDKLPSGRRKQDLTKWINRLSLDEFAHGRMLSVDDAVALTWGRLDALAGRTLAVPDALIAATALVHNLTIATRNQRDFAGLGVRVVNPWT